MEHPPNYKAPETTPFILANRPYIAKKVQKLADHFKSAPSQCMLPQTPRVYTRDEHGNRIATSVRALVYLEVKGNLPPYGFGHTTCTTKGCVNPNHQSFLADVAVV